MSYAFATKVSLGGRRNMEVVRLHDRNGKVLRELPQDNPLTHVTHFGRLIGLPNASAYALVSWPEPTVAQAALLEELETLEGRSSDLWRSIYSGGYTATWDEPYDEFLGGQTRHLNRLRAEVDSIDAELAQLLASSGLATLNWEAYNQGWMSAGELFASAVTNSQLAA